MVRAGRIELHEDVFEHIFIYLALNAACGQGESNSRILLGRQVFYH